MPPTMGPSDRRARRRKRLCLALVVLSAAAAGAWLGFGHSRRALARILDQAAGRGLVCEGGSREVGLLSSTLRDVRLSLRSAPGITVEVGRVDVEHWPMLAPRVSVDRASVRLHGDPAVLLGAIAKPWHWPEARMDYRSIEVTYQHRAIGQVRLSGVTLGRRGGWFALEAARAQVGDLTWRDVRLFFEQRKHMAVIGFGVAPGQERARLSCFPSTAGTARWIFDLPHGPARPLLGQIGRDLGEELDATRVAGSISLDIPDDEAQPVSGRVQLVLDRWPLLAPSEAEPLLGDSLSVLSNLVASADGSRWELPRVELTMPVFSLVGKGSLQLGRAKRLALEVEGERTCRQLRALLPPSQHLDTVRKFLDGPKAGAGVAVTRPGVRLGLRWETTDGAGLAARPEWRFEPGCGLPAWPTVGPSR